MKVSEVRKIIYGRIKYVKEHGGESKKHLLLKLKGLKVLEDMGCTDIEYEFGPTPDLAGFFNDRKIAVECGGLTIGKIDLLKKLYDDVLIVQDTQNINDWKLEDLKELEDEFEQFQKDWVKHPKVVKGLREYLKALNSRFAR